MAGSLVAACTASYTLWDAHAITSLGVNLGAYMAISSTAQFALLSVFLAHRHHQFTLALKKSWRSAAPIAVLAPLSYLLVLVAMNFAPATMIATVRTLNVVFGTFAAMWLLKEPITTRTCFGLVLITLGALLAASF